MALMEMMPVDPGIASLISSRATPAAIAAHNQKRGYLGLLQQATYLLQSGDISLEEAMRFLTKPLT
jgi:type II secretory ATPase GspE/PulE/Tfp pilus assembly ATPase PilB-like protein